MNNKREQLFQISQTNNAWGYQLRQLVWVADFPFIHQLIGVPQDAEWHPEGDVFEHTIHVCDAMAHVADQLNYDGETRLMLLLAAIAHDMGKPETTKTSFHKRLNRDAITSQGHDQEVGRLKAFLASLGYERNDTIFNQVLGLTRLHMRHLAWRNGMGIKSFNKVLVQLAKYELNPIDLWAIVVADVSGRPYQGRLIVPREIAVFYSQAVMKEDSNE